MTERSLVLEVTISIFSLSAPSHLRDFVYADFSFVSRINKVSDLVCTAKLQGFVFIVFRTGLSEISYGHLLRHQTTYLSVSWSRVTIRFKSLPSDRQMFKEHRYNADTVGAL